MESWYHAREAVRYVHKGRYVFHSLTTGQQLAVARLKEEAQEALRRIERDNGQLVMVEKSIKDGSYVPREGDVYGGNRTDVLGNMTLEDIIVAQAPDPETGFDNGEGDEDDEDVVGIANGGEDYVDTLVFGDVEAPIVEEEDDAEGFKDDVEAPVAGAIKMPLAVDILRELDFQYGVEAVKT